MQIILNGKPLQTNCKTLHKIRVELKYDANVIAILDGYQTDEDLPIAEGAELFFIKKGELPEKEAMQAMLCARHTPGVYNKVKNASVAIAGLGGLGSNIAINLARTGIGRLYLIDFDIVEPSNLNRQQYRICHLGMPKAEALKAEIAEINPFVEVVAIQQRLTEENTAESVAQADIVCEAFDSASAKAMLVNTVLEQFKDKYVVAASGMAGHDSANSITTRKLGRLYICGDGQSEAGPGNGLMAPRVAVCAGHQANTILRIILGEMQV